jgi:hypothetical protein
VGSGRIGGWGSSHEEINGKTEQAADTYMVWGHTVQNGVVAVDRGAIRLHHPHGTFARARCSGFARGEAEQVKIVLRRCKMTTAQAHAKEKRCAF